MQTDFVTLVHLYLDHEIDAAQFEQLQDLLHSSGAYRSEFRQIALLHNHLSHTVPITAESIKPSIDSRKEFPDATEANRSSQRFQSRHSYFLIALAASILVLLFLATPPRNNSFAGSEFQKILNANSNSNLHYKIQLEQTIALKKQKTKQAENLRPPKPSLDAAELYVQGADKFVLIRNPNTPLVFVTGSNGKLSWAVAPQGPVRRSQDVNHFNRDLPGHEHAIPLVNLKQGLQQIQQAYSIQVLDSEPNDPSAIDNQSPPEALLIATKRRGERGPKRIEIHYESTTGQIRHMRFVEMPYGPEQITIRLTLLDQSPVPDDFFEHHFHHSSDRTVLDETN